MDENYLREAELKGLIIIKTNPILFPSDRLQKDAKRVIIIDPLKAAQAFRSRPRRSPYSGTPIYEIDRMRFIQQYIKYYDDGYYICSLCSPEKQRDFGVSTFNHIERHIAMMKYDYRNKKKLQEMLWS